MSEPQPHIRPAMQPLLDLLWRIRCAYWFTRRLCLGPFGWRWAWDVSGATLAAQRENRDRFGEALPDPSEAVDDELACWGD